MDQLATIIDEEDTTVAPVTVTCFQVADHVVCAPPQRNAADMSVRELCDNFWIALGEGFC